MEHIPKKRILKMFGECATFQQIEKDEARSYLNSWKKFLIRRLSRDCYDVKIIDEQWGEVPAQFLGVLCQNNSMYLKLIVEFDWKYEEENQLNGTEIREQDLVQK